MKASLPRKVPTSRTEEVVEVASAEAAAAVAVAVAAAVAVAVAMVVAAAVAPAVAEQEGEQEEEEEDSGSGNGGRSGSGSSSEWQSHAASSSPAERLHESYKSSRRDVAARTDLETAVKRLPSWNAARNSAAAGSPSNRRRPRKRRNFTVDPLVEIILQSPRRF